MKRTICIENPTIITLKNKQLHFKLISEEKTILPIPVEDIGIVVFEHKNITFNNSVIQCLQENNVAVLFCNEKHMPQSLLLPIEGHFIQQERYETQIKTTSSLKKQLWNQIVKHKINNQSIVLEKISAKTDFIKNLYPKIKNGDIENCEGIAAAYYWKNVFKQQIKNFKRDRFGLFPNALLNYGYTILRATMARSIVSTGLLPTLGLFHKNRYNAFCLADDLMEPYRPYVDKLVIELINKYGILEELAKEQKIELLKIPAIEVIIGDKKHDLMFSTQQTALSLFHCFNGESKKILYPNFK